MQLEYSVTSWEDVLNEIINSEYSSEEIANGLREFLKSSTKKMEFIPKSLIEKVQVFAKRKFLEEAVTREDIE